MAVWLLLLLTLLRLGGGTPPGVSQSVSLLSDTGVEETGADTHWFTPGLAKGAVLETARPLGHSRSGYQAL